MMKISQSEEKWSTLKACASLVLLQCISLIRKQCLDQLRISDMILFVTLLTLLSCPVVYFFSPKYDNQFLQQCILLLALIKKIFDSMFSICQSVTQYISKLP